MVRADPRAVDCAHCGLPVPRGLIDPDAERQFCCQGCRTVYRVLHEHGLDRYYALAADAAGTRQPARTTGRAYEEFDDPAFGRLYVRDAGGGLSTVELYLEGVHCAACVWLVERVPLTLDGIAETRLDMTRSMATVTWDPSRVALSTIARFLDSVGYPVHPFRGVRLREMRRREDRALLVRIGVAGMAAGNVMLIGFALYGGMFHGMAEEFERLFRWTSLALTVPALVWSAAPFFRGAWGSLRTGALHMDVPISVGIAAGFLWGTWNTVRGTGEIYFDSVTSLIFLLLVGRYVQQKRQRAAADSAELLYSLAPSSARRVEGGTTRQVPVEALVEGMTVQVEAGESIPVDGEIVEGRSSIDTSLLTGESLPIDVGPGVAVHAGMQNLTDRLRVRVTATGEQTRVGRLMRLVEESARRRAPVVRLADRISGWFVAVVLVLAGATAALWWSAGPGVALDHAIALLIVTCPCALGLATPLAIAAAIGNAGRRGILIRGGDALELLAGRGTILLDKTGTLTEGRTRLVRWDGDDRWRGPVAAIEARVAHPVARALATALDDGGDHRVEDLVRLRDGSGVEATVDGHRVLIGSPARALASVGTLPAPWPARIEAVAAEGATPVVVVADGEAVALAALGDPLREEARPTLDRLREAGWRLGILSGDHPGAVRKVAASLAVPEADAHGGVVPEEKLAAVERELERGTVVMVGDGINDAGALSAASVGVAVHGGAEVALAVSDVFLNDEGIRPLERLFDGARRTMRVVRHNLVFSLAYNVVGAGLAMTGLIDPRIAAVLMPLSSLTVISYSFRARTF